MQNVSSLWPKIPPLLNAEQLKAREEFMRLWHEELPKKYGAVEKFNQGYVAKLPHKAPSITLEVGAGLGEHAKYESLKDQDYYVLEYREEFCKTLRRSFAKDRVQCGDIQKTQPWKSGFFDRIIAVHVLEHLIDLPSALKEISRLLKDDGYFDIVLPTEGKFAYTLARKISAERFFVKTFKMDYTPIIRNEHVNSFQEIISLLPSYFKVQDQTYFPLRMPIAHLNICVGMRLQKSDKKL